MNDASIQSARLLRNLYFVRTAVQVIWAAAVIATAFSQPRVTAVLLVLYPLWDVACTVYDLRSSRNTDSPRSPQIINAALGIAAAIGVAVTMFDQPQNSVAILGIWALGAGLLQLVVGLLRRRRLGGQWAMMLSGAQSAAAGIAFTIGGIHGTMHAKDFGGYAIFGAVYFLIAGVLLSRKISRQVHGNPSPAVGL
jgi:uncharacterized membrane protein HdeD (DUF308 family)